MPSEGMPAEDVASEDMPSEDQARLALDALRRKIEAFRSAVTATADQLRGYLAEDRAKGGGETSRAASALGVFAAERIDSARFSQFLAETDPLDGGWAAPVERAVEVLEELGSRGDELFRARVEPGGDLHATVEQALAEAGRAFGAARVAELARSSRYRPEDHDGLLEAFPFRRWSAAERELAPPLAIEVEGGDLLVGGLATYLDGAQQFVLLVEGQAPPAPLVRLITPGVLVMQTDDAGALLRVGEQVGPAVAALMPSDAGRFVQEPGTDGGAGRLEVGHLPELEPRRSLGTVSSFQQREELRLLASLTAQAASDVAESPPVTLPAVTAESVAAQSGTPEAEAGASPLAAQVAAADNGSSPASVTPVDPAGVLAAWLLAQADLTDIEADPQTPAR